MEPLKGRSKAYMYVLSKLSHSVGSKTKNSETTCIIQ